MIKTIKMLKLKDILKEIKIDGQQIPQTDIAKTLRDLYPKYRGHFDLFKTRDDKEITEMLALFANVVANASIRHSNDPDEKEQNYTRTYESLIGVFTKALASMKKTASQGADVQYDDSASDITDPASADDTTTDAPEDDKEESPEEKQAAQDRNVARFDKQKKKTKSGKGSVFN